MNLKQYAAILIAALMAVPTVGAFAQSNPAGNLGSNKSATASPGTIDSKTSPGMHTGDAGASTAKTNNHSGAAMTSTTPGATGKTVVPGTASSPAGSAAGTTEQKSGAVGSGGK